MTGDQVEQRRLVVDVVVAVADREVLEYDGRGTRGQAAEIAGEPPQGGRAAVARLEQRLGEIQAGEVDAARVERVWHGTEVRPVQFPGRRVPAHLVVAGHVPYPAAQRGRDRLLIAVVLARQPGVGDVAAVQHEVGGAPGYGRVHPAQPRRRASRVQADVGVRDHGEAQDHGSSRYRSSPVTGSALRGLHREIICAQTAGDKLA